MSFGVCLHSKKLASGLRSDIFLAFKELSHTASGEKPEEEKPPATSPGLPPVRYQYDVTLRLRIMGNSKLPCGLLQGIHHAFCVSVFRAATVAVSFHGVSFLQYSLTKLTKLMCDYCTYSWKGTAQRVLASGWRTESP